MGDAAAAPELAPGTRCLLTGLPPGRGLNATECVLREHHPDGGWDCTPGGGGESFRADAANLVPVAAPGGELTPFGKYWSCSGRDPGAALSVLDEEPDLLGAEMGVAERLRAIAKDAAAESQGGLPAIAASATVKAHILTLCAELTVDGAAEVLCAHPPPPRAQRWQQELQEQLRALQPAAATGSCCSHSHGHGGGHSHGHSH
eukprot:TRINITY_DN46146_c0_g1_i1.p1 TRINITY_DN46146_c0_g1~~TRINITY_DN46146_c0_g1_i1.p1  ORF type:complete len:231 (+),score=59.47 TRINITY_DN46146_c0_g1_i1:85-693(+)